MKKKKTLFADILDTVTKYFIILVIAVVVCIALSGLKIVDSGNVAVVLRFGRIVGDSYEEQVHEPGLLLAFPYIIDEVVVIPTDNVIEQLVTTHYTDGNIMSGSSGGYVITGDQNIAVISASVKYVISDPVAYALHVNDANLMINASVSNAMITEAAKIGVDSLLTDGKDEFNASVLSAAADKLKAADIGVTISTLELTQVSMPTEVRAIYEQVNSSTVQAATMLQEAEQYRTKVIAQATTSANNEIASAKITLAEKTANANSDLYEFWGVLEEYNADPEVVKVRIYSDKVTAFLKKMAYVRVVEDGEMKIFLKPLS
jgi:membrane protease subunit HflK